MRTGFRKTEFKGGAGTGGVYINDKFVYLKGFSQRTSNEWAGVGAGYPDWMHDFNAQMLRDSNGNYMRWMHVAPQKVEVEAFDRFGIVEVAPAGDKEEDAQGRQWEQRVEVMRDTLIYFRNNPSILFWEAGNTGVTAAQMQQMVDLRKELDPHGGRVMGCRSLTDPGATAVTEWFGTMLGGPYSPQTRDKAPLRPAIPPRARAKADSSLLFQPGSPARCPRHDCTSITIQDRFLSFCSRAPIRRWALDENIPRAPAREWGGCTARPRAKIQLRLAWLELQSIRPAG